MPPSWWVSAVGALAQDVRPAGDQVVDPVLLHRHEHVLLLDVEQLVALQVAVEEEHRGVQPLVADLEAEQADGLGVVLVPVDQLEADDVVEQPRALVLEVGCRRAS
jgi:hypothetical protein